VINNKKNKTMNEKKLVTIYETNDGGRTFSSRKVDINAIQKSSNNSDAQISKEISDEEIKNGGENAWSDYEYQEGNLYSTTFRDGWLMACKWYREKLKQKQ